MIQDLSAGLEMVATPETIMVMVLAGVFGLFLGALPGMTATLAAALLIPFTFFLDPVPAVAAIITMSAMAIFAGDVPSALLRMPGTPSSAAYTEDAYRLTRSGKGQLALGVSLVGSVLGGLFGAVVLIFLAPIVGAFALQFTSFEYFWVAVLGLTAAVIISRGSQLKGAIALMIGLLLSTVGLDVTMGYPRFTFGSGELYRGIDFIPAMIGLFGLSEVLRNVLAPPTPNMGAQTLRGKQGVVKDVFSNIWRYKNRVASGAAVGGSVGVLPGAGSDIAAWISYAVTKNTSKRSHQFGRGKGHVEPIIGASSANNAGLGGAYVPTLAFGIPGDTITAILIGVLLVKGITPGPDLFTTQTDTLYSIYIIFIIANLLLLPLGYLLIRSSSYVLRVPRPALMACIVGIAIVGAFAINNSHVEILIMLGMGILGFGLERARVPLAPVVLGIVLGPLVEQNFMRSVMATNWDLTLFFTRPISAVLIVLVVLLLFAPGLQKVIRRARQRKNANNSTRSGG
ncbi:tripartite tricarboxylate transporter permease [Nesterenkonia sphaerica]|uniref:Tripartite tricarboxylate transporter permease n=2 Tax=Nesterenkonia sphaerica TaxID=1804988 RepID=A0A5R9ALK7_9MICC|nr:tripartite tricarboxylate transporter permease [Nesterenkonia sphaerica]